MKYSTFEELPVWQAAIEFALKVFDFTAKGDFRGLGDTKNQLERAAVGISNNIAEGFERDGNKEFMNFLSIAKGSCGEARSQLIVACDQGYISTDRFDQIYQDLDETGRIIGGLMRYIKGSELRGRKFL